MNETVTISHENLEPLELVVEELSPDIKEHFESIKEAIFKAVEGEGYEIQFNNLIKLVDYIFDTHPTSFINNGVTNEVGQNLGSLKVLSLALLLGLSTDQALRLFGEHWKSVQENPDGNDHQNIRALNYGGIEGIKIHGVPFSEKS